MTNASSVLKEGSPGIPPCQAACPIHQEVREYLRLIAIGDFDRSLEVIKRSSPLSSVCGTICAHHCEDECRRQNVDASIRGLKGRRWSSERQIFRLRQRLIQLKK